MYRIDIINSKDERNESNEKEMMLNTIMGFHEYIL